MFYQHPDYIFQEDSMYQTLVVKSSEFENDSLKITISDGQKVTFKPNVVDAKNRDRKMMSEIDEIVFKADHACFKALYNFAEEIASSEPQIINSEEPKMQSPNFLMCFRSKDLVKFVFVNALPENINEVQVKNNWYAKNAAKNLMKDIRSLTLTDDGDGLAKSR